LISLLISSDLLVPVLALGAKLEDIGVTMPERTVHEHGDSPACVDNIRFPKDSANVGAVPEEASTSKGATEIEFRLGILALEARHQATPFSRF
jgi:hypothetical protein